MDIFRKAKIVAKIADNKFEIPFITSLFEAGADVAWLNTAHQDEPSTRTVIEAIRKVSTRIPIMIDTKGPEIRTKNVEKHLEVIPGDSLVLTGDASLVGHVIVHVTYPNFHNEVPIGTSILYDDASVEMVVEEKVQKGIRCVVKNAGLIKNKKSLNIPNIHISLPALTEKDKGFIHFCAKNEVDFIAHSFVRTKEDIFEIREILKAYPHYQGKIISKIENREGFENLTEILEHSEGIMVARGDLGAEVPLEELPYIQKKMVEAALKAGKYCIVATQVLESMIKHPRPTRAEVTDTANAVLDGSGAVSMSGETAYGDYPIEAVHTMDRIMKYTETKRGELVHFVVRPETGGPSMKQARKIVALASKAGARAIIVMSSSIKLSQALSAERPDATIIPIGLAERDARELMLAYAARPILAAESHLLPFSEKEPLIIVTEIKKGKYSVKKGSMKDLG